MASKKKYQLKLYLFGVATQSDILSYIQTECIESEVKRIKQILTKWREAAVHFQNLIVNENGLAETINIKDINPKFKKRLKEIANNKLFQKTFSSLPIQFKMIEIDKIIACQRYVNLDYVKQIQDAYLKDKSDANFLEICIGSSHSLLKPALLQNAPNVFSLSSPSVDFRFLGGFPKELSQDDIDASTLGGLPVSAIVLLFGYGGSPINVYYANRRVILNNGFHRIYALREAGVKYIPAVVRLIQNIELELPPQILGLPKEYLLKHPRPAMIKDFLDQKLVTEMKVKPRIRTVKISWGFDQSDTPI